MLDIQQMLDDWLEGNVDAQEHVSKLYYVPNGDDIPDDATHAIRLHSTAAAERAITIAAICTPEFAAFLESILALVGTRPEA